MQSFLRLAVGTVQEGVDCRTLFWALWSVLERRGVATQVFLSQARLPACGAGAMGLGPTCRHLDSWLMPRRACREIFLHGARACDLALVAGHYGGAARDGRPGGGLDTLCQWLDLPRVAVVDVSQMDPCRIPARPPQIDGVLLDRVGDSDDAYRWGLTLEALWGVPVLATMPEAASLRGVASGLPCGERPAPKLLQSLGDCLEDSLCLERLLKTATSRAWDWQVEEDIFLPRQRREELNVAVAFDEAFRCYFSDSLDAFESQGATLRDFSPLRDDCLPADTDVVLLGGGPIERYSERLARNHCIKQALWRHVAAGRRIYAEAGAVAFLCEQALLPGGQALPMTGILPAMAIYNPKSPLASPAEIKTTRPSWVALSGCSLRGYLDTTWRIVPEDDAIVAARDVQGRPALLSRHGVAASCLHLHFAAQPMLLRSVFHPQMVSQLSLTP